MVHPLIFTAFRHRSGTVAFRTIVLLVCGLLVGGEGALLAQEQPPPASQQPPAGQAPAAEGAKLGAEQLDALVAPIALYPDNLLAQCLVASTYPVDVIEAQQWLEKNKNLKGEELSNAAMKQDWDPSIQALVSIPDALKVLAQDVKWTTDLGNAFLAQQGDVMDAVQRMRGKAKGGGKLETNEQMKVETKTVESKEVIVIEQANPEVVVVPSYSPTVVYGAPPPYYPYPPLYYPPYYPGAGFMAFGMGVAIGVGISGGWGCGWGSNNTVNINNNNNYVKNNNVRNNQGNRTGNSNWSHNNKQRGGTPYGDRSTANKYGGQSRGDSRQGGQSRGSSPSASSRDAGGGRGGGSSSFGGGGNSVGSRDVSRGGSSSRSGSGSGFSGSSGGSRGASASSSRGSSSFRGSRGGGGGGRRR